MISFFVHQNFPAQYRHIARHLADKPGHTVYCFAQTAENDLPGVKRIVYKKPDTNHLGCHPLTIDFDDAVRTGMAVADAFRSLKAQGVRPDIIVGHNGWGETLFVKDVYPDVPLLANFEFFYRSQGGDVEFDPEFEQIFSDVSRFRTRNAINFVGFDAADWGHTATKWQRSLFPQEMQRRISPIHEGVDTGTVRPNANARLKMPRQDLVLTRADEVITYVSRNLEPYRGFHIFMRALPEILRRRPNAHVVIVGGDDVSYGSLPPPGTTYREMMLREVGHLLDFRRVHFIGRIPYSMYLNLLQVSSVHIYLTYPFVLSWSFIEALSAGCVVIGSSTPPVLEVLRNNDNGMTVDFFSPQDLAERVDQTLRHPDRMRALSEAARATAVRLFGLKTRQIPRWEKLLEDVINRRQPNLDDSDQYDAGSSANLEASAELLS